MTLNITPLEATLGATITGVDLANLDEPEWTQIEDAFHAHAILVFPGQHLSEDDQNAFARRFGDIEVLVPGTKMQSVPLSNKNEDGSLMTEKDPFFETLRGNEYWHTDSSYMPLAAKASMLSAQVVTAEGGETEWADMRAAWDALDDARKTQVSDLAASHSLYHSQAEAGYEIKTGAGYGYHDKGAPLRPLVKTHPVTGRLALYIGRHAYDVTGLDKDTSKQLLLDLLTFACQPPRTYAHTWQPGDLVVWDNRCVLHRARTYDTSLPRVLRHTRVAGDPATELAPTAPDDRASGFAPTASNQ
jgi:alpha-ketoglutarate-dependent taurine dioxygenase